jgi:hypothetical protein
MKPQVRKYIFGAWDHNKIRPLAYRSIIINLLCQTRGKLLGVHKYKSTEKLHPRIQIFANPEEAIDIQHFEKRTPLFGAAAGAASAPRRSPLRAPGAVACRRVSSQSRRDECSRRTHRQLSCHSFITCFWIQTSPARLTWRVVRISDSNSCPSSVFNPVTSRVTLFRDALVVFRTPGQGVQAAQHQPTPALAAQGEFLFKMYFFCIFRPGNPLSVRGQRGRAVNYQAAQKIVSRRRTGLRLPLLCVVRAPQGKNQQVILKYCQGFFGFRYKRISLLVPKNVTNLFRMLSSACL